MAVSAYLANAGSNNVSVVDTVAFTVTTNVTVGNNPRGVAVTPDLTKVYVTNFTDNTVSVIDALTNTVTTTIPVGVNPNGIAVTPDGKHVLTANFTTAITAGTVSVIAVATDTVVGTITLPTHSTTFSHPYSLCISPDSTTAYVYNLTGGGGTWVEFCNIAALTVPTSVQAPNGGGNSFVRDIQSICVSPDNLHVFTAGQQSGVQDVISTVSHTAVGTMTDLTGQPAGICILPNNTKGFWTNSTGNMYPFNPATFVAASPVTLFGSDVLSGIAPSSDSTLVFVGDQGPAPSFSQSFLWKVNSTTPTINSRLSTGQNQAAGVGLSYYPLVSEQIVMIV